MKLGSSLCLLTVSAVMLTCVQSLLAAQNGAGTKPAAVTAKLSDDVRALPSMQQIGQFDHFVQDKNDDSAYFYASRHSDGLRIRIYIAIRADESAAKKYFKSRAESGNGSWWNGSISRRKIGQESLYTRYDQDTVPHGDYELLARDGGSVVRIILALASPTDDDLSFTPQQLRLAEDQAIACFDRLTKLGHTSKSPPVKAAVKGSKPGKTDDKTDKDKKADKP